METRPYISWELAENFMVDAFQAVGVPEADARICADVLLESDRRGIESHGCNRFKPIYMDRILNGTLKPVTEIEILKDTPTTVVMDAHDGMGMVASHKMMEMLIEKAKKYGMAGGSIRNSTHYGIAGYWATMASKEGLIGITGTNARPSIAPTFGVENMMGTNPLTFALQTDEEFPFCLDCATSIVQRGKIEYYAREGKDTPAGTQATVRIADRQVKVGDEVYRLTDARQMKAIREIMSKETVQIPLDMRLYAMPDELPMLSVRDSDGHEVSVRGETPADRAQQRALDEDTAKKQLGKLGGTPYCLNRLTLESRDAFMTAGMLNGLRREALEKIRLARIALTKTDGRSVCPACELPEQEKLLIVQGENLSAAKELIACGADIFEWQPQIYREKELTQALEQNPDVSPALVLPAVLHSDELTHLHEWVCQNASRLCGVVANNPSQFELGWGVPVWGGQGLNRSEERR